MNGQSGFARRYHWHSRAVRDFVSEPHTGIAGEPQGTIMNLVDAQAGPARHALVDIARQHPDATLRETRYLLMPGHHDVRVTDVDLERLGSVLAVAYERQLHDFAELLLVEKLGPRTLQTLALVAEVIHGTPSRFSDPARYSFALGGKDRHPFPVPLRTYDESIAVLRRSLDAARLGDVEKSDGMRRLDKFVRAVESHYRPSADLQAVVAHENAISGELGGRSVFDDKPARPGARQLRLF
jgi:hypothetical protein